MCVFACGGVEGRYWSVTNGGAGYGYTLRFCSSAVSAVSTWGRHNGNSVRLVRVEE